MNKDREILHEAFVHVPVENKRRAIAFYRDKLGFRSTRRLPFENGTDWLVHSICGAQTEFFWYPEEPSAISGLLHSLSMTGVQEVQGRRESRRGPG